MLTPEQFARNVKTRKAAAKTSSSRSSCPDDENGGPLWLPIDAKFPVEDYQRLTAAQEISRPIATEEAMKNLEAQLRKSAKDISSKYINPPRTTDFALMFLPTEGLFAEAIRRIGLAEQVQREYRVIFAGPTTLAALLNSFQMGFRTLAIQKRSSEVWSLLAAVRDGVREIRRPARRGEEETRTSLQSRSTKSSPKIAHHRKTLNRVEELPSHPQPLSAGLVA